MACFHACLNELPSELRGFAFKDTDLIYIHCVSNENFATMWPLYVCRMCVRFATQQLDTSGLPCFRIDMLRSQSVYHLRRPRLPLSHISFHDPTR